MIPDYLSDFDITIIFTADNQIIKKMHRTCGTCLDFYKLKETLAVGSITNMYAIAETLAAAGKVIKP